MLGRLFWRASRSNAAMIPHAGSGDGGNSQEPTWSFPAASGRRVSLEVSGIPEATSSGQKSRKNPEVHVFFRCSAPRSFPGYFPRCSMRRVRGLAIAG